MKKILQSFTLLLCGLLGGLPEARASHLLGCDMTYASLGNNQYRVKFRLYRDCSGSTFYTFNLQARNGGCGSTATITVPLVQQGIAQSATPLCPSTPGSCLSPSSLYPLYDFINFEATVTLPPGQWTLSTSSGNRPDIGNLVDAINKDLYAEAYLDNRGTNVTNTSPQFDPQDIPIQYVCVNQRTTFGFSSIEPDGDSLAYALAAPLSGCNMPIAYKPYPGATGGNVVIITRVPLCVLEFPALAGGGGNYTPLLPLPVTTDTTGTCPIKQGLPSFKLNQSARTVTFTPNVYIPSTSAADGRNKYQVVVEVTEYRRVNGVRRVVGRVRREAVLIVIDCGTNTTPNPVLATSQTGNSNTGTINTVDTTQINVYSCNYSRVTLNFTDPDNLRVPSANQLLTVTLPATINTDPDYLDSGVIGSFTLSRNGTTNPRGTFYFQPSPGAVGRTVRINVKVEDNACPVKGLQNRVIVIKILQGNFAAATAAVGSAGIGNQTPASICAGGAITLLGQVLRPDSVRRLANNTTVPQVYTYQWSAPGNSGLPTATNTKDIVARPTVTTLYTLRTAPTLGFTQGACSDVTTFLVRVVPPPVARATASLPEVCAGGAVLLRGRASRPPAPAVGNELRDVYTYRWTGPGVPATATDSLLTVRPTALGLNTYTLTATGAAPYGCAAITTVQVLVVPPPVATATAALAKVCAGAPVLLTGSATRAAAPAPGSTLPDVYTYSWAGPGVPATATGPTLTVRPTTPGINTYTLTATGSAQFNCATTTTVQVEVVPPPTVRVTTNNAFICPGGTATLQASALAPTGFSDTYTYRFDPANGLATADLTKANPTVRPTVTTRYRVTVSGNAQTGCADTASVLVRVTPALVADFATVDSVGRNGQRTSRPPVIFSFANRTTTLTAGQSPTTTFTYTWAYQRIRNVLGDNVAEPLTLFSTTTGTGPGTPTSAPAPLELGVSGTYRIVLTAVATVSGAACPASVKERLVIVPDLQVPNIITPNGDGLNDQFKVSTDVTASKLQIFNRWGSKVAEYTNYQNNWTADGQPAGTYYYLLTKRNGAQTKGWIEVVRN